MLRPCRFGARALLCLLTAGLCATCQIPFDQGETCDEGCPRFGLELLVTSPEAGGLAPGAYRVHLVADGQSFVLVCAVNEDMPLGLECGASPEIANGITVSGGAEIDGDGRRVIRPWVRRDAPPEFGGSGGPNEVQVRVERDEEVLGEAVFQPDYVAQGGLMCRVDCYWAADLMEIGD